MLPMSIKPVDSDGFYYGHIMMFDKMESELREVEAMPISDKIKKYARTGIFSHFAIQQIILAQALIAGRNLRIFEPDGGRKTVRALFFRMSSPQNMKNGILFEIAAGDRLNETIFVTVETKILLIKPVELRLVK